MSEMTKLPFRPNSILRVELRDIFLCQALEWLTYSSEKDNRSIKSVVNDNPWEAAYCILTILRARDELIGVASYRPDYDQKVENAIFYLVSKVQGDDSYLSLDGNPYDTGLTIQALLVFKDVFPTSDLAKEIQAQKIGERLLRWVLKFLTTWLTDRTVGEMDDIAQCLIAIMLARQISPEIIEDNKHATKIIDDVISELISLGQAFEEQRYWESVYVSSYVLIALLNYLELYTESRLKDEVIKTIRYGIVALEKRFSQNWDQPPDTALALNFYILAGSNNVIKHNMLPEVVYQGFRWLCDPKQRYQNGSIQRNVHYTALFVNSVVAALASRELDYVLDRPLDILSDYIISQITLRETFDRSLIAKFRLEIQESENKLSQSAKEHNETKKKLNSLIGANIWAAAIIVFLVAGVISGSLVFRTSEYTFFIPQVHDWAVLLVFATIIYPSARAITHYFQR